MLPLFLHIWLPCFFDEDRDIINSTGDNYNNPCMAHGFGSISIKLIINEVIDKLRKAFDLIFIVYLSSSVITPQYSTTDIALSKKLQKKYFVNQYNKDDNKQWGERHQTTLVIKRSIPKLLSKF